MPADDVYVWLSGDSRLDAVHALLRTAAYIYRLPAERLAAEARQVIASGESLRRDGKTVRLLNLLPDVDVEEVDWSRANDIVIDMELVEGLVHHPSQWVQRLAALVINERLHGAARRRACDRLLEAGTGDSSTGQRPWLPSFPTDAICSSTGSADPIQPGCTIYLRI